MVAIRPALTSKHALRRAIDTGLMETICAAIGKKEKQLYKYSLESDVAEITVRDALVIDRICYEQKTVKPFADLFADQLKVQSMRIVSIKETVLISQTALGKVADTVVHALSDDSENGAKLSANEIQSILCEVHNMQQVLDRIKAAVIARGKKHG